jgi:hypothetical protein
MSESEVASTSQQKETVDESMTRAAPPFVVASQPQTFLTQAGRPARNYRLPRRFQDIVPEPPTSDSIQSAPSSQLAVRRVILHVRDSFRTAANQFGVLRHYFHRPSYDPDDFVRAQDLANFDTSSTLPPPARAYVPPWPFDNMSKYLLMNWCHSGSSQKTEQEVTRLVKEVIMSPDFLPSDLTDFNAHRENKRLDDAKTGPAEQTTPFTGDDWHEVAVEIDVPVLEKNKGPQKYPIHSLHRRSIIQVIGVVWENAAASQSFHLTPFQRIHVHPDQGTETRIFDEMYTSDAFINAHNQLQREPSEPGCKLEKIIAGLMFWSDSTHLTSFGSAKLWPLYMYFANQSKYTRAKPSSGACHHVAYIPDVSLPF